MKVHADKVKGIELLPGDLFSTADQIYWVWAIKYQLSIGEKVYIRTEAPLPADQLEKVIYRITIER